MIFPLLREHCIERSDVEMLLYHFLESRLRIFDFHLYSIRSKYYVSYHSKNSIESLIEIKCTEKSLKHISKNIWVFCTASIFLPLRHEKYSIESIFECYSSEVCTSYISATEVGHPTLIFIRIFCKNKMCHDEFERSISEKFKAFIVFRNFIFIEV